MCIAPAYCLCKNLLVVNLSSNKMCLVYSRFFFIPTVSRSVALCFGQWIGWSNMDRESEFVCLLVLSNLLSFIFSSGMAFVVCFFCFSCCSCFFALLKYAVVQVSILYNLTWVIVSFLFFIFLFFQEALLSALSCVCVNCR